MASFYCYTTNLFIRVSIAMVAVCQPIHVLNDLDNNDDLI